KNRVCEYICPAKVYEWDEENKKLQVTFENCLECGACRIACPNKAIEWSYPKINKGITFKNS
ncbi:MAG: 4Fe-4S dicluster domain-containing protein, partial [Candidatus Gastranaerophilales bacterium]|nr:4Fe-4S dicluster domain-containing protein [Candidatus Gastranaerophilales bacterium]